MKNTKNITGKKILVSDLKRAHSIIKRDVEKAFKTVLDSGRYILGKELGSFEKEFAAYCTSAYAVGVASGTEALQLGLMALSVRNGDEVITAVNTAIPTCMAIIAAGAVPKFVDVEEGTFNMDVNKLEAAITEKTRAIIPVHLYGNPCDIVGVLKIAKANKLFVVEDACQAHGASYKGRKTGSFGDLGAFSFYPTKNLGCYGDGGMVVTDNKRLADKIMLLRNYGQITRYECETIGINSRLDEIQAAVLRLKLRRLDKDNERRIEISEWYKRYLQDIDEIELPSNSEYCRHVFHLYVIKCKGRDALKEYLMENGIEAQIHYPIPLHLQKAFGCLGYRKGDFPRAEKTARAIMSLPLFPPLEENEVKRISDSIKSFYSTRRGD